MTTWKTAELEAGAIEHVQPFNAIPVTWMLVNPRFANGMVLNAPEVPLKEAVAVRPEAVLAPDKL